MEKHAVVTNSEWIAARKELLAAEKEFTRARDRLSEQRGIDMVNTAYHYLDLIPKGRGEEDHEGNPQSWVRRRDEYGRDTL